MPNSAIYHAYCGAAPRPDELLGRWNFDPVLIAFLAVAAIAWLVYMRTEHPGRIRSSAFVAGFSVTTAAFVSPLCALSVSLFAARVTQHMVLILVAAPLLVIGCSAHVQARVPGVAMIRRGLGADSPLFASLIFAVLLWFWHAPVPYAATFQSSAVYWAMHLSLFGSALILWSALLDLRPSQTASAVAAGIVTTVQMGLLGALITLAAHPIYAPHLLTTADWNLTTLQDQQLGGAIMWIPGCVVFLGVAMSTLASLLVPRAVHPRDAVPQ